MFVSIQELVALATSQNKSISEVMIEQEMEMTQQSREFIWAKMEKNLQTMKQAVERSVQGQGVFSPTGLTGGDAVKMKKYREKGKTLSGDKILAGVQYALGTNEVNAAMGIVCATPTAGSRGTLPGGIFSVADSMDFPQENLKFPRDYPKIALF